MPFLFLLSLFLLSSCVPFTDLPEGVWISNDSTILLYVMPEYSIRSSMYPATQRIGNQTREVLFYPGNASELFVSLSLRLGEDGRIDQRGTLVMSGRLSITSDDEFRFTLRNGEVITFHRVEEYEPINLRDWLQHLENEDQDRWLTPSQRLSNMINEGE